MLLRPATTLASLFLILRTFMAPAQTAIPYGNNPAAGKYVSLQGVRHYYERYGSGPAMLLIHGNSTGIKGWATQIEYFSKKYTVYAIDCRGRGKSDPGKDSLTFEQMATDLTTFLQLLQLRDVSVVGRSDGGIVALMMGMKDTGRINKIVAFGANLWPGSTALYPTIVRKAFGDLAHAEKMLASGDTTKNWYMERQRLRLDAFQPHIAARDLHQIRVPVMVMSCDRDLIREEHTFLIYKNLPMASLCILPGETHHVSRENPDLFNAMVDKFLTQPFKGDAARFE